MIWIAPSENDAGNAALEKRLWDAADQLRANYGLKAQEYSLPVLGLNLQDYDATGHFNVGLVNPPVQVKAMEKERLNDIVRAGRRFPFKFPHTWNAYYLWIQVFYSALNKKGRAGCVMANSASDACYSGQERRPKGIENCAVDVMVIALAA